MSIKGLPARGIYGWDSTTESWVKILVDSSGNLQITSTDLTTVLSELQNSTYGLSAIETLVDEIESLLKNATYGLAVLETLVDGVESDLTAMKQKDTSPAFDSDTDSLEAISEAIAAIETALPSDPADASDIAADFDRHLTKIDFWSLPDNVIIITAAADQDYNLPDVTVPALPTGATIWKVYLLFKCSLIRDTSGSDNGIDEVGVIRIKKDGDASFDGDGLDAYPIYDNTWLVDVTNVGRDRGGDAFVGAADISSKVDGADTYNLRLDSISADGNNLQLREVAVGLRILFY